MSITCACLSIHTYKKITEVYTHNYKIKKQNMYFLKFRNILIAIIWVFFKN